jgi:hypothetical protein
MGYHIAINNMIIPGKIPAGDSRWKDFNDSFVNQDVETLDFANAIYTGHSYAAWHRGRRSVENFLQGQHIAVDMETGDKRSTVDYILKMEFVQVYGGLVYTTPSHTIADPRARAVFFLDQPIADPVAYKTAIGFVYSLFPGSDTSCVDCSRFFYGSVNCQIEWLDNVLPLSHLRTYYTRWGCHTPADAPTSNSAGQTHSKSRQQPPKTADGKLSADALLTYAINDAAGEGRNKRGYRLARQLRELGASQIDAERYLRQYQQAVARQKQHDYTEHEAMVSLKSAYSRGGAMH